MKHFFIWLLICGSVFAQGFNERNVWEAFTTQTLAAGQIKTAGPRDMSDREKEFSVLVYGTTAGDSVKPWLRVYGMMTSDRADTVHMVEIKALQESTGVAGNTYVYADTLNGSEAFSHLYFRLANNHLSAAQIYSMWVYSVPRETTIIRR